MSYRNALKEEARDGYEPKVKDPDLPAGDYVDPRAASKLKQALVRDVETLLPRYFEKHNLAAASWQKKFDHLKPRYQGRWYETWKKAHDLQAYPDQRMARAKFSCDVIYCALTISPLGVNDDFLGTLKQSVAERKARELTDAVSHGPSASTTSTVPSLLQMSTTIALKQLQSAIEGDESTATFACGGVIPLRSGPAHGQAMQDESQAVKASLMFRQCPPVRIFWLSGTSDRACFTSLSGLDDNTAVQNLVRDCSAATFGRGEEEVLDKSYRDAVKLDPERFCTSFHPADFGIIDTIEQMLLPRINDPHNDELQLRRVRAELYKLNVGRMNEP
jgi:hypothetical protein